MVRYVARGRYIAGVPARNMTDAEWEALSEDLRELAVRLNLVVVEITKPAEGSRKANPLAAPDVEPSKEKYAVTD